MDLKDLLNQGRLRPHQTSNKEIESLFSIARRDIQDAKVKALSLDRRFACAYNAVLQLATILLYCSGYRPERVAHHHTVFQAMKIIMGKRYCELGNYFDSCRSKRNITDYDYSGVISESEVKELIKEAERFLKVVHDWVRDNCNVD
ncbi:MAG: HEPN domain-containing protein [Candidatus Saccharicenans sp.]